MRRLVLSMLVAGVMAGAQVSSAGASLSWGDDPPEAVITPDGNLVVVYVTSYAPTALTMLCEPVASYSYTARPGAAAGTTDVEMSEYVPAICGRFGYQVTVSNGAFGSGYVYTRTHGTAGTVTHLRFTVATP